MPPSGPLATSGGAQGSPTQPDLPAPALALAAAARELLSPAVPFSSGRGVQSAPLTPGSALSLLHAAGAKAVLCALCAAPAHARPLLCNGFSRIYMPLPRTSLHALLVVEMELL